MEKIVEILKGILPNVDVEHTQDLLEKGYLDSFSIMQLVIALNDEYDIEISPVEIVPENFKSVETIYNLVKKLGD